MIAPVSVARPKLGSTKLAQDFSKQHILATLNLLALYLHGLVVTVLVVIVVVVVITLDCPGFAGTKTVITVAGDSANALLALTPMR